jgi:hypothetical protein
MEDLSMDKYYEFRKLMDFVSDEYDITDACMNNYSGDIEITGKDETGVTITIRATMKEGENDGN